MGELINIDARRGFNINFKRGISMYKNATVLNMQSPTNPQSYVNISIKCVMTLNQFIFHLQFAFDSQLLVLFQKAN